MKRIEVPGMGVVEFPAEMSDDEISAAIKRNMQPMSAGERFAMGVADPFQGGAQLLTKMLPESVVRGGNALNNWLADNTGMVARLPEGGVDQQTKEREAAYQAKRGDRGMDWMRLGGNVLSPMNAAFGAAALPKAGASLLARAGLGAAGGAAAGALSPVSEGDFGSEKAKQVAFGGIFGGAVPVAAAGIGRVISPKASMNPDLELLKQAGVKPTVGQSLGGRWNATEEKLQSLPIMGDMISNARKKALEDFNIAALNRVGTPIGVTAKGSGQDAVKKIGDSASQAYEAAKNLMGNFQIDTQGKSELINLRGMVGNLPDREQKAFRNVWDYLRTEVSPNGSLTAEGFKRIDSKIGKEAAQFGGSQDAYQQKLAEALSELKRVITDNAKRANPRAAEAMEAADEAWANLVRVEGASKAAKNSDGLFTPAQLNIAIQAADKSVRKRAVGRGTALMQDLGTAGQNVLGNKVPNSGTFDRAAMGVGGLGAYFIDPTIPAALLGGAGLYSSPMQSLLRGAVSARPQSADAIAGLFNRSAPMLGPAGGLLSIEIGK
jgi:hypothetical protein